MSKIDSAIYEIHTIDNIASRDQWVNRIHPLVKLFVTIFYIALVVSFSKYDLIGTAGMAIYLIAGFILSDLSFGKSIKRLRLVLPLVCMVGVFNVFLDTTLVTIGGITVRAGVLSMLTLMLKGIFSVLASYLLIATTTIEKLCYAFSLLHMPKIMITQIMLTYRYISLLLAEVNRITQAYALRAPGQKGIHFKVWGSLTGQLLLRSMDRAEIVFESMTLRGYIGEFSYMSARAPFHGSDFIYLIFWSALLVTLRLFPIIAVIGRMFSF